MKYILVTMLLSHLSHAMESEKIDQEDSEKISSQFVCVLEKQTFQRRNQCLSNVEQLKEKLKQDKDYLADFASRSISFEDYKCPHCNQNLLKEDYDKTIERLQGRIERLQGRLRELENLLILIPK